jgi:hypothetical protein
MPRLICASLANQDRITINPGLLIVSYRRAGAFAKAHSASAYSLCGDSKTRKDKLSGMTRGDLESLMLGRERMMSFICQQVTPRWEIDSCDDDFEDSSRLIYCTDKDCLIQFCRAWLNILQDIL